MVEVFRISEQQVTADQIGVAITKDVGHCGISYGTSQGAVELCDLLTDRVLKSRPLPPDFYWTPVSLNRAKVSAVAEFIELVLEKHQTKPIDYSVMYSTSPFDAVGEIATGRGLTCATFVVAIFERLSLNLVVAATWKSRPEDSEFQDRYIHNALHQMDPRLRISAEAAMRIAMEKPKFRIKPDEVCGAAASDARPVKFARAVKLAAGVVASIQAREAASVEESSRS